MAIAIVFGTATKDSLWRGAAESKGSTPTYRIGDCVTLNSTGMAAPLISKADCGADPSYTVGAIVQTDTGCAVPDYIRYVWAIDDKTIGALCLAENLVVEHCYRHGRFSNIPERVQCTAAAGLRAKVAARLDNTSDVTACPVDTSAFAYPAPPRTYCLINL